MNNLDSVTFYNPNVNLWYVELPQRVKPDTMSQDIANYLSAVAVGALVVMAVASL